MDPPEIITEPVSLHSVPEGENAEFTVEVIGQFLSYQWRKDGVPVVDTDDTYSGTTTNHLTVVSSTDPVDNGLYSVVVSNDAGEVESDLVTLTVSKFLFVQLSKSCKCILLNIC